MLWARRLAVFLAALSWKHLTEVDAGLFLCFLAIVNVVFNHLVLARLVLLAKGEEKLLGQLHRWRVVVMRVGRLSTGECLNYVRRNAILNISFRSLLWSPTFRHQVKRCRVNVVTRLVRPEAARTCLNKRFSQHETTLSLGLPFLLSLVIELVQSLLQLRIWLQTVFNRLFFQVCIFLYRH